MIRTIIYLIIIIFLLDKYTDIQITHTIAFYLKTYFNILIDTIHNEIHKNDQAR